MILSTVAGRAPRALLVQLIDLLHVRHLCHTVCTFHNDVEIFLLVLYMCAVHGARDACPALLTALVLHLLRGEARWQLFPLYFGIMCLVVVDNIAWNFMWYLPVIATAVVTFIVPIVPSIAPEVLSSDVDPALLGIPHVVGVQEVFLDDTDGDDDGHDGGASQTGPRWHMSQGEGLKDEGPTGPRGHGMWVRFYYPTTPSALAHASGAATLANDGGWGFNAAAGTVTPLPSPNHYPNHVPHCGLRHFRRRVA